MPKNRVEFSLDAMSESDTTQKTPREADIIASPPFGSGSPFDPKEPLRVSRRRVWLGIVILIIGLAVGFSAPAFPTAKLWLGAIGLLLVVASFCILGLYRVRSGRGRDLRKLYAHQTHLTNR
jgi:hypothetical protein